MKNANTSKIMAMVNETLEDEVILKYVLTFFFMLFFSLFFFPFPNYVKINAYINCFRIRVKRRRRTINDIRSTRNIAMMIMTNLGYHELAPVC